MKFSAPATITSREVIIARYDAILDQSKRVIIIYNNSNNNNSNNNNNNNNNLMVITSDILSLYLGRTGPICAFRPIEREQKYLIDYD